MYMYIHVVNAGFLELVNNMLTSGMVPALFPDDEKESIIGQVHVYSRWARFKAVWPILKPSGRL